jgi:hypothetical protein
LPPRDLEAFFFEDVDDMNDFTREMRSSRGLNINCVHVGRQDRQSMPAGGPVVTDDLRSLGISAFVSQTFNFPDEKIKNYFDRSFQLTRIPIGDDRTYRDVENICKKYNFNRIIVGTCS